MNRLVKLDYSRLKGVLSIVGFGFLAAAAFTVSFTIGLVVTGVVLLLIDFMAEKS